MAKLPQVISDCSCGRLHECPVKDIVIGEAATAQLPEIVKDYSGILLVADNNTYRVCGERVDGILGSRVVSRHIYAEEGVVIPNETAIDALEADVTDGIDLILGVGSGVINDLCKIVSFRKDLPYVIVATAPSMDGYASVGAALILGGMKITLNARPPIAIVADSDVLRDAPMDMIRAGYGDIVGKYSCLNDWKLAAFIRNEYFCQMVFDLVMQTADRIRDLAEGIKARDAEAVAELMDALVTVGVAMSYVGNSRPASGSEHHLSHFFEITGIVDGVDYLAHGVDVAYSAVVTAGLREEIREKDPVRRRIASEQYESDIRGIYKQVADGVLAQQQKLGWYEDDSEEFILAHIDEIRAILAEAPTKAEMQQIVEAVGLRQDELLETYGEERVANAVKYAKDLKDRYSVLWVYDLFYM